MKKIQVWDPFNQRCFMLPSKRKREGTGIMCPNFHNFWQLWECLSFHKLMTWTVLASKANLWSIKKEWCLEDTLMGKEEVAALAFVLWKQSSAVIIKAASPGSRWVREKISLLQGCIFSLKEGIIYYLTVISLLKTFSHRCLSNFNLQKLIFLRNLPAFRAPSAGASWARGGALRALFCWWALFLCIPQRREGSGGVHCSLAVLWTIAAFL